MTRRCLECGKAPSGTFATQSACEFCGGVLETLAQPVVRACYRCGAAFTSDTASTETFCPACVLTRESVPAPSSASEGASLGDHPLVREFMGGVVAGLVGVAGFFLLPSLQLRGELCLVTVLLLAPIAAAFGKRRATRWSVSSIVTTLGALVPIAAAAGLWQLLH